MSPAVSVRRLGAADAVAIRDIRLEGLRLYPQNFGASWEEESVKPLTWWETRWSEPVRVFGAEAGEKLAGILAVSLNPRVKSAHHASIGAVYVRPQFHQAGIATLLMQSAMECLLTGDFSDRAKIATLTVTSGNQVARRLYERFGFKVCAHLDHELLVDGQFYDELMMRRGIP